MKKLVKNIKLMVAVSTMLVMFAIAPVVYGGITWSGFDPIFYVDGTKFNVRAELPSAFICSISGPIEIGVTVPAGSRVKFISESSYIFDGCEIETNTRIFRDHDLKGRILIQAFFPAYESFPVRLKVDRDGVMVAVYEGFSNEVVTGKWISLNANNGRIDPVLTDSYNEIAYTYMEEFTR